MIKADVLDYRPTTKQTRVFIDEYPSLKSAIDKISAHGWEASAETLLHTCYILRNDTGEILATGTYVQAHRSASRMPVLIWVHASSASVIEHRFYEKEYAGFLG